jgi:hypothetical protein
VIGILIWQRVFLEGNPYLLAVTMAVSLLHTVFDFLAFKNGKCDLFMDLFLSCFYSYFIFYDVTGTWPRPASLLLMLCHTI